MALFVTKLFNKLVQGPTLQHCHPRIEWRHFGVENVYDPIFASVGGCKTLRLELHISAMFENERSSLSHLLWVLGCVEFRHDLVGGYESECDITY